MTKKTPINCEDDSPDFPVELEKSFKALARSCADINQELERMNNIKNQYERAIEAYFSEIEKNPSKYRRSVVKDKKTIKEELREADILSLRKDFRKKVVEKSTAQFFLDWDKCECRERTRCVRLNCDPIWFFGCCYLCLSLDVIQCDF